jgi:uncharacterized protein (TIGR00369 family)
VTTASVTKERRLNEVNPAHAKAVLGLINHAPHFELLGMKVVDLAPGYCRMVVDLEEKHLNPFGGVHGGVYSSLIDTAAYWATYYDVDEDAGFVTIDLRVDNLAATQSGRLVVEGRRIEAGKTICLSEASVTDAKGGVLAHGQSKMLVTAGGQTLDRAVRALGRAELPPKYVRTTKR